MLDTEFSATLSGVYWAYLEAIIKIWLTVYDIDEKGRIIWSGD